MVVAVRVGVGWRGGLEDRGRCRIRRGERKLEARKGGWVGSYARGVGVVEEVGVFGKVVKII